MAVTVSWKEPVLRQGGVALAPAEITGTEIALSSDNGTTYSVLATVAHSATQTIARDLANGAYKIRLITIDTLGQRGTPLIGDISVRPAPPGAPTNLTITVS